MSFFVTYYAEKNVIQHLRNYQKAMNKYIDKKGQNRINETRAQNAFEQLIVALKNDVELQTYLTDYDRGALKDFSQDTDYDNFLTSEIHIVSDALGKNSKRSKAIVYNSLGNECDDDEIDSLNKIINVFSASHRNDMARIKEAREKRAEEKKNIKNKIRRSLEYTVAGIVIVVVNNTVASEDWRAPSTTLGAGAFLTGVYHIRGHYDDERNI